MIDKTWYKRPAKIRERVSAGGVVARYDDNGTLLVALIHERDYPDFVLPKGGMEQGETLEQTARREIEEEAGLTNLTLICKLGQLERLSFDKACWQITHCFLFHSTQIEGTPTDIANHFGVWWFPIDGLPRMFWPDQKELIEANKARIQSLLPRK